MKKVLIGVFVVLLGLIACNKNDFEQTNDLDDYDLKAAQLTEAGSAFMYGTHVFVSDNTKSNPEGLIPLGIAKNRWGWANNLEITLQPETTVTDIDGNVYRTVTIGNQVWMAENLRVTKFNNGSEIQPFEMCPSDVYGTLYDGFLQTEYHTSRNHYLAPEGWRIPTLEDWKQLCIFIGGTELSNSNGIYYQNISQKLKEVGYEHWNPLINEIAAATDEYGFTALPSGRPSTACNNARIGASAYFWTSTKTDYGTWGVYLSRTNNNINAYYNFSTSEKFAIRCIKETAAENIAGTTTFPIYMGAALNNLSKGTLVGNAELSYDGEQLKLKCVLNEGYEMNELHIYAKDTPPTTIAPGQYGFTEHFDIPANEFETSLDVPDIDEDGKIWIILHAVVDLI